MIPEKVLICGVVKNAANFLHISIDRCHSTGALFEDYRLIIYENNSTDNTKELLSLYAENPYCKFILEDIPYDTIKANSRVWAYTKITGSDHPCRIEQIANARNKVLAEISKEEYNDFIYVIWIDLDTDYWSLDGIREAFETKHIWDVVYANGIEHDNFYFDMFAFRDKYHHLFGAEIIGETFWEHDVFQRFKINPNPIADSSQLIPIVSAFGGLGIYKKSIFNEIKYDCVLNDDVKTYYRNLLDTTAISITQRNHIATDCKKFTGGYKDETHDIHWKNNSGYDNVVLCEHVCFNMVLYNRGYKAYIHPNLVYLHR